MADEQTKDRITAYEATDAILHLAKPVLEASQAVDAWCYEDGIHKLREHCDRWVELKLRLSSYVDRIMNHPYREDRSA